MAQQGSEEQKKPADEEEELSIDFNAILHEDDPENVAKRELEERKKLANARKRVEESKQEEREILEKIYNRKPKKRDLGPLSERDDEFEEDLPAEDEEEWENFAKDKEGWTEGDLDEEWIDAPQDATGMFYDPKLGVTGVQQNDDEDDLREARRSRRGRDRRKRQKRKKNLPPGLRTPELYVPFRRPLPPIPDDEDEIEGPEGVLKELEMLEEFLDWDSYVFKDGSSYEGTTFNDLAQGKGVYTTSTELCRYEGEWSYNMMQGHGVLTVDVPKRVPAPDSEMAKREGEAFDDKFMSPEDKEWLRMELEDLDKLAKVPKKRGRRPFLRSKRRSPYEKVPFEESPMWKKLYGMTPPKGRYKYSGQLKHNRMHGCGVYELNGKMIWGKWYFGELLNDPGECDLQTSGFHAALAEVAASKARMFTNKPDGMVREIKGPYTDPSHPYMYEEDDMWMAPGFINEFHPVPKTWAKYVEEVDNEREMWLNSFTQAPFRIPMPPELEHLWDKEDEFVLLGNEPNKEGRLTKEDKIMAQPDLQGKVLLHVPSKQIINWAEDKEGNLRFFVQPFLKDGKVDPSLVKLLPLGFDSFLNDEEGEEPVIEGKPATKEQALQQIEQAKKRRQQRWEKEDILRKAREEAEALETKREVLERDLEDREDQIVRMEDMARELELEDESLQAQIKALDSKAERVLSGAEEEQEEGEEEEEGEEGEGGEEAEQEAEAKEETEASTSAVVKETTEEDGEDEEEDEDEDDKGPRSFGKVAMVDGEAMREAWRSRLETNHGSRGPPPAFPSVFASITLASQAGLHHLMHSAVGAIKGLRRRKQPWASQVALQETFPAAEAAREAGRRPAVAYVALAPTAVRRMPVLGFKAAPSEWLGQYTRANIGRKHGRVRALKDAASRRTRTGSERGKERRQYAQQVASIRPAKDSLWVKPDLECLSLALPLT